MIQKGHAGSITGNCHILRNRDSSRGCCCCRQTGAPWRRNAVPACASRLASHSDSSTLTLSLLYTYSRRFSLRRGKSLAPSPFLPVSLETSSSSSFSILASRVFSWLGHLAGRGRRICKFARALCREGREGKIDRRCNATPGVMPCWTHFSHACDVLRI